MPATALPPPYVCLDTFVPGPPHPVAAWGRHVDAGRIGARAPMDPAVLAGIRAAEAIVLGRRGRVGGADLHMPGGM